MCSCVHMLHAIHVLAHAMHTVTINLRNTGIHSIKDSTTGIATLRGRRYNTCGTCILYFT